MESFKFILVSMIVLAGVSVAGYWAVRTIEPGSTHVNKQKQMELEEKNKALEAETRRLKNELADLETKVTPTTPTAEQPTAPTKPATTTPALKYQSLINELQKLIDGKIVMKEKSVGTRVGTLQTFLNIYNKTSKKVGNEFGPGTKTDIIAFQKAVGLTADGEAGPGTFQKMIDWLKKQ